MTNENSFYLCNNNVASHECAAPGIVTTFGNACINTNKTSCIHRIEITDPKAVNALRLMNERSEVLREDLNTAQKQYRLVLDHFKIETITQKPY